MTDIACGCHDSCPDAPDINVNNTNVYIDGALANWRDEYFSGANSSLTLAYIPYQIGSILFIRNGTPQPYPTAWTIAQNILVPIPAMVAGEYAQVHYFAAGNVAVTDSVAVGTMIPWPGSTAPAGYLFMDGTTSLSKATYPNLWAFVNTNSLYLSATATEFVLKDRDVEFYDVATVATVRHPAVIKY